MKSLILFAGLSLYAFKTNPTDESLKLFLQEDLKRSGIGRVESVLISKVQTKVLKRKNYYLFSMASDLSDGRFFFGIFGFWFILPTKKTVQRYLRRLKR